MLLQQLKETYKYDPDSGQFTRVKASRACKVGRISGCLDKSTGYVRLGIGNTVYHAHRLAWLYMTGELPSQVDHINGIRHDNRFINLRNVTTLENNRNAKQRVDNISGITGVYYNKKANRWVGQISIQGKHIHLGNFITKEEAIEARRKADKYYGFSERHGT